MPTRVTIDLIRRKSEHNDGEITTLEELSLHQEDLLKIELIDTQCRNLKILYLQNNLIGKIENLSRLKALNYLNLALNNVLVLEGLEGCEMLEKLDLTVNFIADLRNVKKLRVNRHLNELYLTGNPCSLLDGYREYVVASLPQLKKLDGVNITRSERILATQEMVRIEPRIHRQVEEHIAKEEAKAAKAAARKAAKPGFDGSWYTDTSSGGGQKKKEKEEPKIVEIDTDASESESDLDDEEAHAFWQEESDFTPASRIEAAEMTARQNRQKAKSKGEKKKKKRNMKKVAFFREDGKPYNMNEAGWSFELGGQMEEDEPYHLDFGCYKHLDTDSIDLDVQPNYVRIVINEKVFQLHLLEEVAPDAGKAERSKVTGRLLVTMPKVSSLLAPQKKRGFTAKVGDTAEEKLASGFGSGPARHRERLEVGEGGGSKMANVATIVADAEAEAAAKTGGLLTIRSRGAKPRENDPGFVDDDDVPPLE